MNQKIERPVTGSLPHLPPFIYGDQSFSQGQASGNSACVTLTRKAQQVWIQSMTSYMCVTGTFRESPHYWEKLGLPLGDLSLFHKRGKNGLRRKLKENLKRG